MKLESGTGLSYSAESRLNVEEGTSPEELVGAAIAASFTEALANQLADAGFPADLIHTIAQVTSEGADAAREITSIHVESHAVVPGIDVPELRRIANEAKGRCPVTKLMWGAPVTFDASLALPRALRSQVPLEESAP
ncbi:OsmC family peroxiredoxin [Myxococcota bacterium]|nr:OsmC family peroxiredoxin [Myxococcota bacterium]